MRISSRHKPSSIWLRPLLNELQMLILMNAEYPFADAWFPPRSWATAPPFLLYLACSVCAHHKHTRPSQSGLIALRRAGQCPCLPSKQISSRCSLPPRPRIMRQIKTSFRLTLPHFLERMGGFELFNAIQVFSVKGYLAFYSSQIQWHLFSANSFAMKHLTLCCTLIPRPRARAKLKPHFVRRPTLPHFWERMDGFELFNIFDAGISGFSFITNSMTPL